MIEAFEDRGIAVTHAWGMTEMSPSGTHERDQAAAGRTAARSARSTFMCKQGYPLFGVEMKITDDKGKRTPPRRQERGPAEGERPRGGARLFQGRGQGSLRSRRLVRHRRCRQPRLRTAS